MAFNVKKRGKLTYYSAGDRPVLSSLVTEEQPDGGPLAKPGGIPERLDVVAREQAVESAAGNVQRRYAFPHVADEPRDDAETDPEIDPGEDEDGVLEELLRLLGGREEAAGEGDENERDAG